MKKKTYIILIILAGLIFYFNSLFNGLVWDDEFLIKDNPYIKSIPLAFNYAFSHDIFPGELLFSRTHYYRPLQTISYSMDFFLWKDTAFGFHLSNLFLHIGNALFVYLIISLLYNVPLVAFLCALFFVVHPIHNEAVSYISGRADLLAALFILGSFYCFLKYRLKGLTKWFHPYFILSFICFFLALFSKEYAIICPFLFLSFDISFKKLNRQNLKQYLIFLPLVFIYLCLRLGALGLDNSFLGGRYSHLLLSEFLLRLFTFLKSIPFYLGILIFPVNLHMGRTLLKPTSFLEPWVWMTLILLFICLFASIRKRREQPIILFLFLWFLIFIFSQSAITLASYAFAEHFLYLASISIFFIFAYTFVRFFDRFQARSEKQKFILLILSSLIIFYGSLTSIHNLNWKDDLTFYKWTVKFSPKSIKIRINLGNQYTAVGRHNQALAEYEKARELLANVDLNRYKDKSILDMKLKNSIVKMHYNLGVIYSRSGNYFLAEKEYRKTLDMNSNFLKARNNLAALLTKLGRQKEAIEELNFVLGSDPNNIRAYYSLGAILANLGQDKKARQVWQDGLEIEPDNQRITSALGRLLEK